jgi:hypothetical protein
VAGDNSDPTLTVEGFARPHLRYEWLISNLTQEDADALLAMEKHKVDDTPYEYPSLGGGVRIPLLLRGPSSEEQGAVNTRT